MSGHVRDDRRRCRRFDERGDAPKNVGIIQWLNAEAAMNWAKSPDALPAQRRYLIEAEK